jgi:hypothetical protein
MYITSTNMGFGFAWLIMDTLTTVLKLGAYSPRREKEHAHNIKTRPMSQDIFHIWIRPAWGSHPSRQLSLSSPCCVLRGEGAGQILIDSDLGHIRIYGRRKRCKHLCFPPVYLSMYLSIHPSIHPSLSIAISIYISIKSVYLYLIRVTMVKLPCLFWDPCSCSFAGVRNQSGSPKPAWPLPHRNCLMVEPCIGCIGIGP